jgi:hypothetical protein
MTLADKTEDTVGIRRTYFRHRRLPLYPGYDPNGYTVAANVAGTTNVSYNQVKFTIINWVTQCFVGNRGSIIWHYNAHTPAGPIRSLRVWRKDGTALSTATYQTGSTWSPVSVAEMNYRGVIYNTTANSGQSLTDQDTQAGMSVLAPNYSEYKMLSNDHLTRTLGSTEDGTQNDSLSVYTDRVLSPDLGDRVLTVNMYAGIGTDFNPFFFCNVPTLRVNTQRTVISS